MKHFRSNAALPRLFLLAVGALVPARFAAAADWNQWRGPNRDGSVSDFKAPAVWTKDSLAKKWTVTVGEGHSSPVVVGDRVYVFTREDDNEVMRCLSAGDGALVWKAAYAAPYEFHPAARAHGKGPKSTPAVADGRIFALGINGHVSAYDARTGAVLWRRDFNRDFKSPSPAFGAATSPVVDGNNVIVHVGGDDSGALMAFDVATGQVRWKWNGDGPGYASPVIATFGGVRQLITQSQKHCLAVSPAEGKLLWKIPFTTPYEQNIVTPLVVGDLVVFGGIQKSTFALKVMAAAAEPAWETREITMYMSSPVLSGTTLYGMSDKQRGMLFALNASDGAVRWKSDGRLGDNGSLTDIGSAVIVVTTSGELIVHGKTGNGLKELMRYKIADSPVWASPAVVGNQILLKDKTTLSLYKVDDRG